MNTKEAIEWMRFMKRFLNCQMPPEEGYSNDYGDKIDEVINLLECNEKYREMFKEIKEDFNVYHCNFFSESAFNKIKQKYFPKRINRIIEVEVEASNQEVIDELAKDIEDMANGQSHRKGKIGVVSTRWIRD